MRALSYSMHTICGSFPFGVEGDSQVRDVSLVETTWSFHTNSSSDARLGTVNQSRRPGRERERFKKAIQKRSSLTNDYWHVENGLYNRGHPNNAPTTRLTQTDFRGILDRISYLMERFQNKGLFACMCLCEFLNARVCVCMCDYRVHMCSCV